MHGIMGADNHEFRARRDPDARLRAREGLLIFMRMMQRAGAQHRLAVGRKDFPFIREMLPAGIGMAHGDVEGIGPAAVLLHLDADHISLSGECTAAPDYKPD